MGRNVKIRVFRLSVIDNNHSVYVYKVDCEKYLANPSSSQMETKNPPQKGFVKYFGIINLCIVLVLNAGLAELRPSQAGPPEINRFVPLLRLLFHKIAFVPLIFRPLFPEINAPCSPKTPGMDSGYPDAEKGHAFISDYF